MKAITLIGLLTVTAAGAAGCTTPVDAPLSPTFGTSLASLQAQVVQPVVVSDQSPAGSGARGVAAVRRYERGEPRAAGDYATSNVSAMNSGPASAATGGSALDR